VGDNGPELPNGIANYDLLSTNDQVRVLDYNGDGYDDLFLYRPGRGAAWVARSNGNGTFTAVYAVGDNGPELPNGIAGYDLLSTNDQVRVLDYDGNGDDDLFLYRPGKGASWFAESDGFGGFTAVNAVGDLLQDACLAHAFAAQTYDYYLSTHKKDLHDHVGPALISTVEYKSCRNDAAWTGKQVWYCSGAPLANDVVAHEWTHALVSGTANLIYWGQSGALNESYADVFGVMIDRENWLMAENWPNGGTRNLCDPPVFGQPDHFSNYVNTFRDRGGVHTNSGIPNKAACLLAEGGMHNGVTVTGIGRAKVEHIYYRALTTRLFPTATFIDAFIQSEVACSELSNLGTFGIVPADCAQVGNAFRAVGL
jgi:hypothetical protein